MVIYTLNLFADHQKEQQIKKEQELIQKSSLLLLGCNHYMTNTEKCNFCTDNLKSLLPHKTAQNCTLKVLQVLIIF